jgi:hypothetical protein
MLRTLPSIEDLGRAFMCSPHVKSEHPEHGALIYEVEYESEHERISLSVLPVAQEVNDSVATKSPTRIIRLSLGDVAEVKVEPDEDQDRITITFESAEVQPLVLYLKPTVLLLWGNRQDSPERHPPWEPD